MIEEIEKIADVSDSNFIFKQNIFWSLEGERKKESREIVYYSNKCSGCRFCVYACPVNAISSYSEQPFILIDHTICCFCGICSSLCPDRAIEFRIDGVKKEPFVVYKGAEKLESCAGCAVCYTICPANAVKIKPILKIDDIHEREFGKNGTLRIDLEKCKKCGRCTLFCDALVAVVDEGIVNILFNEDRCDYCGLCEEVCPNKAIEVVSEYKVEKVGIKKVVDIEIENCIECGLCEISCPYDGVKVHKSIEGEIKVNWRRLEKYCDWESCRMCINICKSKAWYVEEGKLKLKTELCRFCRACMYVCPEKLIEVKVKSINCTPEWSSYKLAINRVLNEKTAELSRSWLLEGDE